MTLRKIILASSSPRRKQLLEQLGLAFSVDPSDCPEDLSQKLEPHALARKLALQKALSVASRHAAAVVIAADTFGVLDGRILGKPRDAAGARDMLAALSGRCHSVISGIAVADARNGKNVTASVETQVYFRRLTPAEIDAYVATGEPLDKAGAYAIQGLGAALVERIEGDYFNVVGLPLCALCDLLKDFDIKIF